MKKINQLVNVEARQLKSSGNPAAQGCAAVTLNKRIPEKIIDRLFMRFSAMYGHIWNSQFRSDTIAKIVKCEWGQALAPYAPQIIGKAIDICRSEHTMPPTLPQFIALCRHQRQLSLETYKLPSIDRTYNSDVAARHLSNMKLILGMNNASNDSKKLEK